MTNIRRTDDYRAVYSIYDGIEEYPKKYAVQAMHLSGRHKGAPSHLNILQGFVIAYWDDICYPGLGKEIQKNHSVEINWITPNLYAVNALVAGYIKDIKPCSHFDEIRETWHYRNDPDTNYYKDLEAFFKNVNALLRGRDALNNELTRIIGGHI